MEHKQKLRYQTPARTFSQALPIGNGSLGAMIYGGLPVYQCSLNLDTLWSGRPGRNEHVAVSEETRQRVRRLLKEKKYFEAQKLVQERMTGESYNESYVGAGFLTIAFADLGNLQGYQRTLDLDCADVKTTCQVQGKALSIQSFVSGADGVFVTEILSEVPLEFTAGVDGPLKEQVETDEIMQIFSGCAPRHVEPNYVECENPIQFGGGMKYVFVLMVQTDGEVESQGEMLKITQAKKTRLLLAGATGYQGYGKPLEEETEKLKEICLKKVQAAGAYQEAALYERHCRKFQKLFERVQFSLESGEKFETIPVNVRLENIRTGKTTEDQGLYELLFSYGRYLMITSSRPDGKYSQPANLQGLWCEEIRPAWSGNYTININTEMNYWLNGPLSLQECAWPLIHMIQEIAKEGRTTAKETLGCRGFAVFHNVDLWRQTTPVKGDAKWAFWPMGGVWLATHAWQQYLFTGDWAYLKETAYPILKDAALFVMDWLWQDEEGLHTGPSTSPENTFYDEEKRECAVCSFSTMDAALIRELLGETLQAGKLLEEDRGFLEQVSEILGKLPEYQMGKEGQLLEWEEELEEVDVHHRHFAHLAGFHPFHQISFEKRPEFLSAVEMVLKRRLSKVNLFIGWDEAWLVNFYARLQNGKKAKEHLNRFLTDCAYDNLFSLHPPLGESAGEMEIFQIDGNFGIAAGIGELLLNTNKEALFLLPALPDTWKQGSIQGLTGAGGHKVSLWWKNGGLERGELCLGFSGQVRLCCKDAFYIEELKTGAKQKIQAELVKRQNWYQIFLQGKPGTCYRIFGEEKEEAHDRSIR